MFREIYKLFIECSLYEDVNVANQRSDQKSHTSKLLIALNCLGFLVMHCAMMS